MMNIETLLDSIIIAFLGLSLLICISLLITIFIYLRPFSSIVSVLLIFNIYFVLFLTCISMIIIYIYKLYGDRNPLILIDGNCWCQLRTYFVNVCFCSLYYSCVLKSFYRFIRIIFYQNKILQSYRFFLLGIVFQWFLSFILILFNLFHGDYQYLPYEYRCWISFENIQGLLIATIIIYICPLLIIFFIYFYIVRYVVRQTNQIKQRKTIERDLVVLKRIIIFVLIITSIGLPTVFILFIWIISGKLIPLAYSIQGLSMSIGLFIVIISFAIITPQIQEIFHNTNNQSSIYSSIIHRNYRERNELVLLSS